MYRLYDMLNRTQLYKGNDELKIVDEIGYDMANKNIISYLIVDDSNGYDNPGRVINSRSDYVDYLNEVKNKYSSKTLTKHL